jgi:acyl-CoA synthetase (NDP forming)
MSIRRTVELGFEGEIWPVNPKLDEIEGFPCFDSIADLPGVPDAAFIGIRSELTVALVRTLSDMGAGGCVCYAAGFSEIGGTGTSLQEQLVEAAGDMPLVGPNGFGFINYIHRCALWPYIFDGHPPESGAALISQSGNIAMNLTMNKRSVRFTHVIGAGNQAVMGAGDYVDALLDDERVTAIGMYVEGFDDVDHFALAAERAADKGVPLVVMKVGRTEAGAQQSSSHTSSLAGSDNLYDAFFERLGIVRVNSFNQLLETLKIFDCGDTLTGRKIVTLSCSGGEAAVIADAAPAAVSPM